jgi:hypothetical protein
MNIGGVVTHLARSLCIVPRFLCLVGLKNALICECLECAFQRFTQHTKRSVRIYVTYYS